MTVNYPQTLIYRHRSQGFTLLELLVVIVIIGLLAGLVAPRYFETVDKSKIKVVRAQMDTLSKVLEQYRLEVGTYPTQEQGLDALMVQPAGVRRWQGPYLKKEVPVDPWGNPYLYQLSGTGREFDLVSQGSDGQPGGEADSKDIALSDKSSE
ncbi:MAG: type II secretion system major pseudopilin GspG [Pseudomonadota bacterium]